MKIAIVADPYWPIPPNKYGGTERVVANLITGLIYRGHQVTLFAAGDSRVNCHLVSCCPKHINVEQKGMSLAQVSQAIKQNHHNVLANQNNFDIIHWHAAPNASLLNIHIPLVITPHNPYPQYKLNTHLSNKIANLPHIAPSKAYQTNFPQLNYVGIVHHGINPEEIKCSPTVTKNVSFVGRFSPEKQPHLALRCAIEHNLPIKIAAKIDASSNNYFHQYCQPLLKHPLVDYQGEINDHQRNLLFSQTAVNLHPVNVSETFGLTIVEAGLAGTPTVAFRRGAIPELIVPGVSGYIANSYQDLYPLYLQAIKLNRHHVRKQFEKFNINNMAQGYEKIYQQLISSGSILQTPRAVV